MSVCQWHLDIPFGKQGEVLAVMGAWGAGQSAGWEFRRAQGARLLAGMIGPSASQGDEAEFETLAGLEAALGGMRALQFRRHSQAPAPLIVPGSPHRVVDRVLDERRR